jgi:glycosyltransferase involved in cell wall biosynthesis
MHPEPTSVTLTLGSGPYQQRLPSALLRHGMLRRVLHFGPDLEVLDANDAGSLEVVKRFPEYKLANRILWGLWRRLPGTRYSQLPKAASTWLADRLASRFVPPSTIFHGCVGNCLACMRAAKRHGAITVMDNPTLHLERWQDEVIADCLRFEINPRHCGTLLPTPLIHRARREYELCDRILVLSSVARAGFEELGYGSKAILIWPGVDHLFFAPPPEPRPPDLFRACYVGRVEVAKGVGYLLQAWKRLALPQAELLLVGEIKPEIEPLLRSYAAENVRPVGAMAPEGVARSYRESSVFVFPSSNEGLALVLLEAMACGLPVIASEKSGASDCVTEGKEGFVVPARNVDALADRIGWCYRHPVETVAMGGAARARIEQEFTLAHYERRQIMLYRSFGH